MDHRIVKNSALTSCTCCGSNAESVNVPIINGTSSIDLCESCSFVICDVLDIGVDDFDESLESDASDFLASVESEIEQSRGKYPTSELSVIALMEEVGEVAKAVTEEDWSRVRAECVQVACMAARVSIDGDVSTHAYRESMGLDIP